MFFKRIGVYALCFWIAYLPIYQAHAFVPAVAVSLGSNAVRYVATDVVLDLIAKGFASNDPLYKTEGKLPKSKYNSWLKGNGKKVAFVAAGFAALGWVISESGDLFKPNIPEDVDNGGYSEGSYFYSGTSMSPQPYYYSLQEAAQAYLDYGVIDLPNKRYEISTMEGYWRVSFYGEQSGNPDKLLSAKNFFRTDCSTSFQSICETSPDDSGGVTVSDNHIESDFYSWVSSQPEHEQKFAFSGNDGFVAPDLEPDIQVPPPPTMPDGTPIPGVGDQLWVYADWIARGVGQNADPSLDYYIPPQVWEDAYYLAHTVAGGNQAITTANANGSSLPETNPDNSTNSNGDWSPSNPLPVIGPMTFNEYQTYTNSNFADASTNLGTGDIQGSKNEITVAMDNFIDNSVSIEVPEWEFNPFGYLTFGGGQCLPFNANLSIGSFQRNVVFDSHCAPYEEFVRPTLEWSLYLMTALNVYMIFTRTVRSV